MAITFNDFSVNAAMGGLGTFSLIVPNAGPYTVSGKIMLPTIVGGGGPSSCLTTINLNGSPVYVGNAGDEGFKATFLCAAGDTVAVVFTSAAAADQPVNAIKAQIGITQGVS